MFRPGWDGRGTLEFADGRHFHWVSTNLWGTEWAFTTMDGKRLLRSKHKRGLFRLGAQLVLEPDALALTELSLLVVLGLYLTVLMSEDAAATAATTIAATSVA
jgi:hypothetical protein